MKEQFDFDSKLNNKNLEKLNLINNVIEEYAAQGFKLTLRQLYYQLVSKDIIPNNQKEYHNLSVLLVKGRMLGLVDWNAIEDRIRNIQLPFFCDDIPDAISIIADQYRLDRMKNQNNHIEIWCEKDALSNIILDRTKYYHIRLMINRGYSSASAMYESAKRLIRFNKLKKHCIILYLGDHDPSGLDMIRDISDRLFEFNADVEVNQIALNMEQVKKFNLPPNPAKITDPRSDWYINEYGDISWELDAIPPKELLNLLDKEIIKIIDVDKFYSMIKLESYDKRKLISLAENY